MTDHRTNRLTELADRTGGREHQQQWTAGGLPSRRQQPNLGVRCLVTALDVGRQRQGELGSGDAARHGNTDRLLLRHRHANAGTRRRTPKHAGEAGDRATPIETCALDASMVRTAAVARRDHDLAAYHWAATASTSSPHTPSTANSSRARRARSDEAARTRRTGGSERPEPRSPTANQTMGSNGSPPAKI